jgi:hypothetical protein
VGPPPPHAGWVAERLAHHGISLGGLPAAPTAVAVERVRFGEAVSQDTDRVAAVDESR